MNKRRYLVALVLSAGLALSCSVKEERNSCPCLLSVDLSSCASLTGLINISVTASGRTVGGSFHPGEDPSVHDFEIPRGPCEMTAVSGGEPDGQGLLTIPYGEQCGEYFVFNSSFTASGESVRQEVKLHKEHAVIRLDLSGSRWEDKQYVFVLSGNTCGVAINGCIPVPGPFRFKIPDAPSGFMAARVPRQVDDSLVLAVCSGAGTVAEFRIGEMLKEMGYDWTERDLKDIVVKIPDSIYDISVSVSDWTIMQVPVVII